MEIVKAGAGSSAIGLSAYIARDARRDHSGEGFNFAHRAGELEAGGLILPQDAPEWAADAARVWREAERAEQTLDRQTGEWRWKKGGQIAKHMTIALPREATAAQRQAMLLDFVERELQPQQHGVAVEWAIHRDDNNPHAHVLISTRSLSGDGFGKKARAMNPDFASKGARHFISEAENWDSRWAAFQSDYFREHGITAEVRERRAVPEEPLHARADEGRAGHGRARGDRAGKRGRRVGPPTRPGEILEQLTAQRAIFTARDVRRALNKSGLEGDEREALEAAIIGHAEVIALANGKGEEIGWTTRQVRAEEQAIIGAAARIGAAPGHALGVAGRAGLDARRCCRSSAKRRRGSPTAGSWPSSSAGPGPAKALPWARRGRRLKRRVTGSSVWRRPMPWSRIYARMATAMPPRCTASWGSWSAARPAGMPRPW